MTASEREKIVLLFWAIRPIRMDGRFFKEGFLFMRQLASWVSVFGALLSHPTLGVAARV